MIPFEQKIFIFNLDSNQKKNKHTRVNFCIFAMKHYSYNTGKHITITNNCSPTFFIDIQDAQSVNTHMTLMTY